MIGYFHTGGEFYIDKEDFDRVKNYTWHMKDKNKIPYVTTHDNKNDNHQLKLHRLIMNAPDGYDVDHINHNVLDNRKLNLRICTRSQNCINKSLQSNNKTGHPGLCWRSREGGRWEVYINVNGKGIYCGGSKSKEKAIEIRKKSEQKYFQEYNYKVSDTA